VPFLCPRNSIEALEYDGVHNYGRAAMIGQENYTVSQKVCHHVLVINSSNIDQFSKCFSWRTLQEICNKVVIKYHTYTIL